MRLLFVVNDFAFFLSHRSEIGRRAAGAGYDVHVAAPGVPPPELAERWVQAETISLSRRGTNPLAELRSVIELVRLFHRLKPDVVHLVTIKPVLYGGVAARAARVPGVVSAISGLGTLFTAKDARSCLLRWIVELGYRVALNHRNQRVIFQNPDDRDALIHCHGVESDRVVLIRGSGVPLREYPFRPEPVETPVVVFAARLLREKGVEEFVAAARILQDRDVRARFWLVGDPDPGNPSSVRAEEVQAWGEQGFVKVLGHRPDIAELFSQAHVVTLPSYREGLPKVLIEAAACGRAVVTTDVPGCRDAIEPDRTGLLVPARDALALADALQALIEDPERRRRMGQAGRDLAEREFAIDKVVGAHLAIYRELTRGEN